VRGRRGQQYAIRVHRFSPNVLRPFSAAQWFGAGLFWTGVALTLATQNHLRESVLRIHTPWFDSFRFPLVECLFWSLLTPFLFWLVQHYDLFSRDWAKRAVLFLAVNAAVVIVHALYRLPSHRFVYPKMEFIPAHLLFRLYVLGNVLNDTWVFWSVVALAHLAMHYVRSTEREKALAEARMRALKSQLHPHFFFNALHSISSLMREDVEAADDMITRLSDLLRVSLKTDATHEVKLREEMEVVKTYIDIERMRFSDRLRFECDIGEDVLTAKVPALILLPLVENAVRHGIAQRSMPGRIVLSACRQDGKLLLTLMNDARPDSGAIVEGIGLGGTRNRLMQHYGDGASLAYSASSDGVVTVQMRLPFVPET